MTGYIINTFAFLKALYAREAQQRRKQQNKDVANKIDLAYDLICMSRLILFHLNWDNGGGVAEWASHIII